MKTLSGILLFLLTYLCLNLLSYLLAFAMFKQRVPIINNYSVHLDRLWWLGLTDEDTEGHWVWFDTNTAPEYTGNALLYLTISKDLLLKLKLIRSKRFIYSFFFVSSKRHNGTN